VGLLHLKTKVAEDMRMKEVAPDSFRELRRVAKKLGKRIPILPPWKDEDD